MTCCRSPAGSRPAALRRRVQIDRILPPAQRQPGGRDRVVLDLASDQFTDGLGPPFPMAPGDSVTVLSVAERRRDVVMVHGNVWTPGDSRLEPWHAPLATPFAWPAAPSRTSTWDRSWSPACRAIPPGSSSARASGTRPARSPDLPLQEDDEITVFSRSTFRPLRYVAITGAVRKPGRVPFREGMTLRDALLEVEGLTEDALLTEAESHDCPMTAAAPRDASPPRSASRSTRPTSSTGAPTAAISGRPGIGAPAAGPAEVQLQPYDNILFFRQPDWELQRTVTLTGTGPLPRPLRPDHPHRPAART